MAHLWAITTAPILSAALGSSLALGLSTGDVVLFDAQTPTVAGVVAPQAHEDAVRSMAWFKDTDILITGDDSGCVKLWRAPLVEQNRVTAHRSVVRGIACAPAESPLSKFATCSDDYTACIRDLETLAEDRLLQGHGWDVKTVDWHPSEPVIATGGKDNAVYCWDVRSGREETKFQGHRNTVNCVRFSPSGMMLLSGGRDRTVKEWDWRTGTEITSHPVECEVTSLLWNFNDDTGFVVALLRRPEHARVCLDNTCKGELQYWISGGDTSVETHLDAHDAEITGLLRRGEGLVTSVSHDKRVLFWE